MSTRLTSVVFDARDPAALARWWSEALGWPVTFEDEYEVVVEPVDDLEDQIPVLVFVGVDDPKTVKNRVHLDLATSPEEDRDTIVDRLLAAGATRADVGQTGEESWRVLADPEGNEFCVLEGQFEAGNPLAAIALDSVDPRLQAEYWKAATGWVVVEDDEEGISLGNPNGHKPNLDLLRVPEPHVTKNRLHLDVAPPKDADHAAEVERLLAAGATRAEVGQTGDETWTVLADPEGNETCVLSPRD
jgi:Glyoxalase-like domain